MSIRCSSRLVLLAALAGACGPGAGDAAPPRSIVLVSIDTLRADHLGCYGYDAASSPHLDALAERSVRFANAWAPAPWTLPSHVAMLSGRHPYAAGIVAHDSAIPEDVPLVAPELARSGYQTAAFVDASPRGLLGGERGFARGFDVYAHAPHGEPGVLRYDAAATVSAGLDWLAHRDPERPFFLFLHTKSVHTVSSSERSPPPTDRPYAVPDGDGGIAGQPELRHAWRDTDGHAGVHLLSRWNEQIEQGALDGDDVEPGRTAELVAMYDATIAYVDAQIGRLRDGLVALGLDDAVLVVTADHGEAFLDHRFFLHREVHPPLLRVPLLVYDPQRDVGRVVAEPVALEDVATTVRELAGLDPGDGRDVAGTRPLPLGDNAPQAVTRTFMSYHVAGVDGDYEAWAIRRGPYQLVYHVMPAWDAPRVELYDARSDPLEQHPLAEDDERSAALLGELLEWRSASARAATEALEIGEATREHLRALGYLR